MRRDFRTLFLCLSLLLIGGCAAGGWGEPDTRREVPLQMSAAGDRYFSIIEAKAALKGDELLISGRVRKLSNATLPKPYDPRIDVVAVGSDDQVIGQCSAKFLPLGMRRREKDFSVRLPCIPASGMKVIVTYQPSSGQTDLPK